MDRSFTTNLPFSVPPQMRGTNEATPRRLWRRRNKAVMQMSSELLDTTIGQRQAMQLAGGCWCTMRHGPSCLNAEMADYSVAPLKCMTSGLRGVGAHEKRCSQTCAECCTRTEPAELAREGQEQLVAARLADRASKAVCMQTTAR
jgi:hypothetical protein